MKTAPVPFLVIRIAFLVFAGASLALGAQDKPSAANAGQEAEIKNLIEQLVFDHPRAAETPLISPMAGVNDGDPQYKKQFDKCGQAFRKLTELGEAAFPSLAAHLDDKRPSIHFRNHYLEHSVGDACYWNIYFQLTDHPKDYSSYGYARKGRNGELQPKPYWDGTPFDEAGGLPKWLEQNKALSYPEKQIKCLNWLLVREKAIGAPDAGSYFENILPLEIHILERQEETGANVEPELNRLRQILKDKKTGDVPPELLPAKTGKTGPKTPR